MIRPRFRIRFSVADYDLAATLDSGQAFRWVWMPRNSSRLEALDCAERIPLPGHPPVDAGRGDVPDKRKGSWVGVVDGHWVALDATPGTIVAETVVEPGDWSWLRRYLQIDRDLAPILASFPQDAPLLDAVATCRGLRVLRQEPWECLASFLLSSTKQIVQIRQGVKLLCERFSHPVAVPPEHPMTFAFPTAAALAGASESELRACRIGFRARYLRVAAEAVASGRIRLSELGELPITEARNRLMELPGVGRKIADCVLLFAYGFGAAFPVDVWVMRALRDLYFRGVAVPPARLLRFSETHFGPWGGYAQQYLFHSMRLRAGRVTSASAQ